MKFDKKIPIFQWILYIQCFETDKFPEKNPPINEKMIEAMMSSMGRKPSQKQVRQVMQQMNRYK